MNRAILTGAGTFVIDEAPVPTPGPGEIRLRVGAVGICGSDLHMFSEGQIGGIRIEDAEAPFVPGHEAMGTVDAVGPGVDGSLLGRRVAVEPAINCGRCAWCLRGEPNVCPHHSFLGLPPQDGALQEFMVHPARLVLPVPDALSDDEAVLLEPLAVAVHALDRAGYRPGEPAIVLGAGPIGLSILLVLADAGCPEIVVTDKLDYRLDLARQLGATVTLNPLRDDVVSAVERQMPDGCPFVFEAAGDEQTFAQMVEVAGPGGRIAVVGIPAEDRLSFRHSLARRKGLSVQMVRRSNLTTERALAWRLARDLPLGRLATHHWPLAQAQQAMRTAADYADGVVKGMIRP